MVDAADIEARTRGGKSASAFRTISEVSTELDVPQHVLRFWESKFPQIKPLKRGGGRRYYRPDDVELLRRIQVLLYKEGYTIKGVQRLLKESRGTLTLPANDSGDGGDSGTEPAPMRPTPAMPFPPPAAVAPCPPAPGLFDERSPENAPTPAALPAARSTLPGDDLPAGKRRELEAILEELRAVAKLLRG